MGRITQFRQLTVWQEAHKLVLEVYRVTKGYPSDERFGLVSQMRRAAVSVPANIAEGFKRPGIQEKIRFYNVTEGSLEEVKYFLILSKDLGYLASADDLISQAETVGRILHGLIASTERRRWRPILHTPYSILHTSYSHFTNITRKEHPICESWKRRRPLASLSAREGFSTRNWPLVCGPSCSRSWRKRGTAM